MSKIDEILEDFWFGCGLSSSMADFEQDSVKGYARYKAKLAAYDLCVAEARNYDLGSYSGINGSNQIVEAVPLEALKDIFDIRDTGVGGASPHNPEEGK